MQKAILYIHGKGGSSAEAGQYRDNCPGYDVIGVDYEVDVPWLVKDVLRTAYEQAAKSYASVSVLANSIGAYLAMHALKDCNVEKALFISPILDMEKLICDMMHWAGVTEETLLAQQVIPTDFGETLSWAYLQYVRANPIRWEAPTEILYAGGDNLTSRSTVDAFARTHHARVTVMEQGEHWFHTEEQMAFLNRWMKDAIR